MKNLKAQCNPIRGGKPGSGAAYGFLPPTRLAPWTLTTLPPAPPRPLLRLNSSFTIINIRLSPAGTSLTGVFCASCHARAAAAAAATCILGSAPLRSGASSSDAAGRNVVAAISAAAAGSAWAAAACDMDMLRWPLCSSSSAAASCGFCDAGLRCRCRRLSVVANSAGGACSRSGANFACASMRHWWTVSCRSAGV